MAKRMYKLLKTVLVILSFSYEKLTPYVGTFTILITSPHISNSLVTRDERIIHKLISSESIAVSVE